MENVEPLAIRIYECFECQDLPLLGRPACAFDSGILTTVFSRHFGKSTNVVETHCYWMGPMITAGLRSDNSDQEQIRRIATLYRNFVTFLDVK